MQKILSLGSEIEILKLLHAVLKRGGYEHHFTTDPQEALALLHTHAFDLLTQDLRRPNLDGADLYDVLRQDARLRHTPVLIISALDPFNLPAKYARLIADLYPHHYVTVPFVPRQILSTIQNILLDFDTPLPPIQPGAAFMPQQSMLCHTYS